VSLSATSVSFGKQPIPDPPSISLLKNEVSLGKLTITSEEAAMGPSNLSSSQITKLPLLFNWYELRFKALEEQNDRLIKYTKQTREIATQARCTTVSASTQMKTVVTFFK
jgi:hypothetical protein